MRQNTIKKVSHQTNLKKTKIENFFWSHWAFNSPVEKCSLARVSSGTFFVAPIRVRDHTRSRYETDEFGVFREFSMILVMSLCIFFGCSNSLQKSLGSNIVWVFVCACSIIASFGSESSRKFCMECGIGLGIQYGIWYGIGYSLKIDKFQIKK